MIFNQFFIDFCIDFFPSHCVSTRKSLFGGERSRFAPVESDGRGHQQRGVRARVHLPRRQHMGGTKKRVFRRQRVRLRRLQCVFRWFRVC